MSTIQDLLATYTPQVAKELSVSALKIIFKLTKISLPSSEDPSVLVGPLLHLFSASHNPHNSHQNVASRLLDTELKLWDLQSSDGTNSSPSLSTTTTTEEESSKKRKFDEIDEKIQAVHDKLDQVMVNFSTLQQQPKVEKILINQEVNDYISKRFGSIASTDPEILAEYESTKRVVKSALILAGKSDDEEAKELVSYCERKMVALQHADNPLVAAKITRLQSSPLLMENMQLIEAAYKMVQLDANLSNNKDASKEAKRVATFSKVQKNVAESEKKQTFNLKSVKCFTCQQYGHRKDDCPKNQANKKDTSLYSNEPFFRKRFRRRIKRKITSHSLCLQSLGGMAKKRGISKHCRNVKRWSESKSRFRFSSIQRKGKFERMERRRKKLVVKRGRNSSKNWCNRRMSRASNCFKIQIGTKERLLSINNRYEAIEQVLFHKKVQVQDTKEVSRVCTKRGYNRGVRFNVRHEVRLPSDKGASRIKEILCLRGKWQGISIHSPSIWLEWLSLLLYRSDERSCEITRNRFNAFIKLFRRFWYFTFKWLFTSTQKFSSIGNGYSNVRNSNRKEEKLFKAIESVSTFRDIGRFRKEDFINECCNNNQNKTKNWNCLISISSRKQDFLKRFISYHWYCYCLSRLFSACESNAQSYLFIRNRESSQTWLGRKLLSIQSGSLLPSMDNSKSKLLEWEDVSISKSSQLFLDRCFKNRLGSSLQREKSKDFRSLVETRVKSIDQCIGIESYLACSSTLEENIDWSKFDYLFRLFGSSFRHKKRRIQINNHFSNSSIDLENNLRTQYSTPFIGMVVFSREYNSRCLEQNSNGRGSFRLGNFNRSFQPSSAAIECINRIRSICQPVQLQSNPILYKTQNQQGSTSRFILPSMDRTSNQLVLRPIQSNRTSDSTLHRIQSTNGSNSSSMEVSILVETPRTSESEIFRDLWTRFQTYKKREGGALEKVLEIRSQSSGRSLQELTDIALMLMPHHIKDSTASTYDSYWRRLIEFAIRNFFRPPPSEDLVFLFVTDLFINWPSGGNCKQATFAIKNRCKLFGVDDPTTSQRIKLLISGMCNVSFVFAPRIRNPWSIVYIRKWIQVGKNFVPEKSFIMYTTLMILGLRAMFRGSELGGILVEDVKITLQPVKGVRVTARRIKNNPKGRTACIEATSSELCPFYWIQKLLKVRDNGPYLFSSHFALDTRSISWILRQIAIWLNIEGKFSSHSLRIGGATDAAYAKIGKEAIKAIGDWSSNAIDRYLRSEFSIDRNVSKDLGF